MWLPLWKKAVLDLALVNFICLTDIGRSICHLRKGVKLLFMMDLCAEEGSDNDSIDDSWLLSSVPALGCIYKSIAINMIKCMSVDRTHV